MSSCELVAQARSSYNEQSASGRARERASTVDKLVGSHGQSVIGAGCGHGFCKVLAAEYDCELVSTEVLAYPECSPASLDPISSLRRQLLQREVTMNSTSAKPNDVVRLLYDDKSRLERARERASRIDRLMGLRGQKVLEIGCGHGDLAYVLAEEYGCQVVGVEVRGYDTWSAMKHHNLDLIEADISALPEQGHPLLGPDAFDRIISYVVWEHMRHPYAALQQCQYMLKATGKKYLHAYLGGAPTLSHLYHELKQPWIHLTHSVAEIQAALGVDELPWYFWCNRLTHSHYLTYFRQLGFYVAWEHVISQPFDEEYYRKNEKLLGLFPLYDLKAHALQVVLEFDSNDPKKAIADPVYALCRHRSADF